MHAPVDGRAVGLPAEELWGQVLGSAAEGGGARLGAHVLLGEPKVREGDVACMYFVVFLIGGVMS